MEQLPFIIIFNEKAYNLYKDKIEFLNKIKNDNASLNILTDIVLYLLEIDLFSKNSACCLLLSSYHTSEPVSKGVHA